MVPALVIAPLASLLGGLDPEHLIVTFGTIGILLIVFAESGLLIGFFLPGDSLLFTAGFLVSQDVLTVPLPVLLVGMFVAAVAGDQVGYLFGRRAGPALFRRPDSRIFRQHYVEQSREFFERHGAKTIVIARFVPIVRTFAPILAGVGAMNYRTFVTFNVVGGFVWTFGVTTLGFFLGSTIPDIDRYLLPAIAVIIVLSVMPAVVEILRHRRRGHRTLGDEQTGTEPTGTEPTGAEPTGTEPTGAEPTGAEQTGAGPATEARPS